MSADVIRADGLAKRFGPVLALRDVSMHLEEGEVLGLIGDNGAGKSTLIKILTGFHQPDTGQLYIDGEAVTCTDSSPQPLLAGLLLPSPEKSAVQFQIPASSAVTVEFEVA